MAIIGGNTEYDPEPFVRRKTFYVKAECKLAEGSKPLTGKMFIESLEPLLKRQQYPIVLIHGDYHTGQVRSPATRKRYTSDRFRD